jgi:hypothetical protein
MELIAMELMVTPSAIIMKRARREKARSHHTTCNCTNAQPERAAIVSRPLGTPAPKSILFSCFTYFWLVVHPITNSGLRILSMFAGCVHPQRASTLQIPFFKFLRSRAERA